MPFKPLCGHSWLRDEKGTFLRCQWCGALGYRQAAPPGALPGRIFVYVCEQHGCREPMTDVRTRRCALHARRE